MFLCCLFDTAPITKLWFVIRFFDSETPSKDCLELAEPPAEQTKSDKLLDILGIGTLDFIKPAVADNSLGQSHSLLSPGILI